MQSCWIFIFGGNGRCHSPPWFTVVLVVLISFLSNDNLVRAFTLEGSSQSYVIFPKWYHAFENLLTFDFKTRQENGLLLYTDDGGRSNFYEITLANGTVQLRFKIGRQEPHQRTPRLLEIDRRRFNDGQWHKVELFNFWEHVRLKVDDLMAVDRLETQQDFVFGRYEINSEIFVGGIPSNYAVERLSSPTVQKVMHFAGEFRNLVYRTMPHGVTSPHLLRIDGARESNDDYCQKDLCRNGGICYSTDEGPKCNCNYTDFIGDQCMTEREFREATFFGGEYLVYDLTENRNGFMSREERLSFRFRTRHLNGMLFYCGDQTDYLHVALKDGVIVATANVGGGTVMARAAPSNVDYYSNKSVFAAKFNDNGWHSVEVHRRLKKHSKVLSSLHLSVVVDDTHYDIKDLPGQFDQLTGTLVYVGGAPPSPVNHLSRFPQVLETSNFVGCLSKVRFNVSGRVLDFLELAKMEPEQSAFLRVHGNLSYDSCRDKHAPEPLSFLDADSYVRLSPGWQAPRQGSISFKFRTNEPDGLILYNGAPDRNQTDFVAFELLDGQLYFVLNLGSGVLRLQATADPVNDGQRWHTVTVHRDGREGRVSVDQLSTDFSTPGKARRLDMGDTLYVGGMAWTDGEYAPASLHTATLRRGFIGCFRDLRLNGLVVDLLSTLVAKPKTSNIQLGCFQTLSLCSSDPCKNEGVCREGYNRYTCDCTPTFYEGATCEVEPTVMEFESGQYVRVGLGATVKSEAEDISIKFRTLKPSGLLVAATSANLQHGVELRLSNGVLEYQISLGKLSQPFFCGNSLNDDRWHTAKVKRRDRRVELVVDQESPSIAEIPFHTPVLHYDTFWAGQVHHAPEINHYDGSTSFASTHGFEGQMAAFRFNHYDVFERAFPIKKVDEPRRRESAWNKPDNGSAYSTAHLLGGSPRKILDPVTVETRHGYISFPDVSAVLSSATYNVSFLFRTFEANGLLLFARSNKSKDFLALELKHGKIRLTFNSGGGVQALQPSRASHLNDFKWHSVQVRTANGRDHFLTVDNATVTLKSEHPGRPLNLNGNLFFGGTDADSYKRMLSAVAARHGFKGCLASLEINGARKHLLNADRVDVKEGCQEPAFLCQTDSCSNGGTCVQQANSVRCDCSMTTYSGPKCEEGSVAYKFGPAPGLIKLEFVGNDFTGVSTTKDQLVLGLITNQTTEATIFRVDSREKQDYLYLELVNGTSSVAYNIGSGLQRIGDLHKVNDGQYHVIRFEREGPNSTFQLDSYPKQHRFFNKPLQIFNNQYQIQIGGRQHPSFVEHQRTPSGFAPSKSRHNKRRSLRTKVEKPFHGIVSGLYYNTLMPLDLAATRDPRITIDGDVVMHASQPRPRVATSGDQNRAPVDESLANWNMPPNSMDSMRELLKDRMMMSSSVEPSQSEDDIIGNFGDQDEGGSGRCPGSDATADDGCTIELPSSTELITPVFTRSLPVMVTPTPRTQPTRTTSSTTRRPTRTTPTTAKTASTRRSTPSTSGTPCPRGPTGQCEEDDDDDSGEAQVEILLPRLSTPKPRHPTTAPHARHRPTAAPSAKTAVPPPTGAMPNPPSKTSPTKPPPPTTPPKVMPQPPRPTVESAHPVTPSPPKAQAEEEKGSFPKTVIISAVAIGLIVGLILTVFIVFKCRHRTTNGDSYSTVDDTKQYTNLNTTTSATPAHHQPTVTPAAQPEMTQSRSFISTRVTQVNGFSRTGKKKDVKEWYV